MSAIGGMDRRVREQKNALQCVSNGQGIEVYGRENRITCRGKRMRFRGIRESGRGSNKTSEGEEAVGLLWSEGVFEEDVR